MPLDCIRTVKESVIIVPPWQSVLGYMCLPH